MATNKVYDEGRYLRVVCSHPTTPASGDAVRFGSICGVAQGDEDAEGYTVVDFRGVYDLSVKAVNDAGNSAVAAGEPLFFVDGDTPHLSKKDSGYFFGFALEAVTSGATGTIQVLVSGGSVPGSSDLVAGVVETADIADDAVTADKIAADAVETAAIAADAVTGAEIADDAVNSEHIAAGAVDKDHLSGGFLKVTLLDGAAAGDHTLTGIAVGDELAAVLHISTKASVATIDQLDLSEFSVAAGKITNTTTDTTNDQLLVFWLDLT